MNRYEFARFIYTEVRVCSYRSSSMRSLPNWNELSVKQIDPDQARRFVGPDLGPNCLSSLSADDTRRQRVNTKRGGSWTVFAVKYV